VIDDLTPRERELGAIIRAYNDVTEELKTSHERLGSEVQRLREELLRKNEELRRRERLAALGELAAGMAHEIRNPLGGIQVLASLLERDLRDRPEQLRLAAKIIRGVRKLETIVADILTFGRPADPNPARVELDKLVAEAIELAAGTGEPGRVSVDVRDELAGVSVTTDGVLLQRALLNLLINAVEATGATRNNGRVVVGLERASGDDIGVTVSDDGPGVPAELMNRIFDPFFTTKDTGTGLGLAIVHQIAESLGGCVRVANREEGGAVFSLQIPKLARTPRGSGGHPPLPRGVLNPEP
jgi:signal transduction histidine kinase